MRDLEGPTKTGVVGTFIIFILSFTWIQLFRKESQIYTVIHLTFLLAGTWYIFSLGKFYGFWYFILSIVAAYLIHSLIGGLYTVIRGSTGVRGPL